VPLDPTLSRLAEGVPMTMLFLPRCSSIPGGFKAVQAPKGCSSLEERARTMERVRIGRRGSRRDLRASWGGELLRSETCELVRLPILFSPRATYDESSLALRGARDPRPRSSLVALEGSRSRSRLPP
jgi:hypothetical protein